MTRERLRQFDSLVQELHEEQERMQREERHVRLMEATYGVGCLFGAEALEQSRARVLTLAGRDQALGGVYPGQPDAAGVQAAVSGRSELGRDREAHGIWLGQRAADAVRAIPGRARRLTTSRDLANLVDTRFQSV